MNCAMSSLTKTLSVFPTERIIVGRERAKGSYQAAPYFLAKLAAESPISALFPALFGAIVYPACGLQQRASRSFLELHGYPVCLLIPHLVLVHQAAVLLDQLAANCPFSALASAFLLLTRLNNHICRAGSHRSVCADSAAPCANLQNCALPGHSDAGVLHSFSLGPGCGLCGAFP